MTADTIDGSGHPLAFRVAQDCEEPDAVVVHARTMGVGHQKEALVYDGRAGAVWRLTSDEGPNLKGTDLAPFPLAFLNAALGAEVISALQSAAVGPALQTQVEVRNRYRFQGSFFSGTGQGSAIGTEIVFPLRADASATRESIEQMVSRSVLFGYLSQPLRNTFALHVNGRPVEVTRVSASTAPTQRDPFLIHRTVPVPAPGAWERDAIQAMPPLPGDQPSGVLAGRGEVEIPICGTTSWDASRQRPKSLVLPMSRANRFAFVSDPAGRSEPSPHALFAAGVAFCYLTQYLRYIEYRHYDVQQVRIVQRMPLAAGAIVMPVDSHIFITAREDQAVIQALLEIAENTCYAHAMLRGSVPIKTEFT